MKKLYVFCDGACSMNKTWTGGWSYLIYRKKRKHIIKGGYEFKSTNNRMEVYAILSALRDIRNIERSHDVKYNVEIISDSGYAVFPFIKYGWVDKWRHNRFDKTVPNYDLWRELIPLVIYFRRRVSFVHIRGHGKNDNPFYNHFNGIVDEYAVKMRLKADDLI